MSQFPILNVHQRHRFFYVSYTPTQAFFRKHRSFTCKMHASFIRDSVLLRVICASSLQGIKFFTCYMRGHFARDRVLYVPYALTFYQGQGFFTCHMRRPFTRDRFLLRAISTGSLPGTRFFYVSHAWAL